VMGDLHEGDVDRLILAFERAMQGVGAAQPVGHPGPPVLGMPEAG
jgi:hypothetical protein